MIGSGRAGPIRKALVAALDEARESNRMSLEHEVRALIAMRYAAIADLASKSGDGRAVIAAGDKLLELLDTLPVRASGSGGGGEGDAGTGGGGKLLGLVHSGPEVGDTADA